MKSIMQRKRIWFWISLVLILPGLMSLFVWKLNLGIDFKGGSLAEYSVEQGTTLSPAAASEQGSAVIKKTFSDEHLSEPVIQVEDAVQGNVRLLIKSKAIDSNIRADIVRRLAAATPKVDELSFQSIDPQVGADAVTKAVEAIVFASAAIILYIAISFRGVPKPASSVQFGVFAVIALLHDVVFIIGFYSIMGHFFGWEVNSEFVTAALTVMGFSVHDTIVVFDRLRENLKRFPSHSFQQVADMSVIQTIGRSLNTSLTVILVLLSVVLLGGDSIRPFAVTLLVGIAVGTYSSIFVAASLLDWWQQKPLAFIKFPRLSRPSRRSAVKTKS